MIRSQDMALDIEQLAIFSVTNGGSVGIGTQAPAYTFEVSSAGASVAQMAMVSSGTDAAISVNNTASGGREYWIDSGSGSTGVGAGNFGIYDRAAGATRLVVTTPGTAQFPALTVRFLVYFAALSQILRPSTFGRPSCSADGRGSSLPGHSLTSTHRAPVPAFCSALEYRLRRDCAGQTAEGIFQLVERCRPGHPHLETSRGRVREASVSATMRSTLRHAPPRLRPSRADPFKKARHSPIDLDHPILYYRLGNLFR